MQRMPQRRRAAAPPNRYRRNVQPVRANREVAPPAPGTLVHTVLIATGAPAAGAPALKRQLTRPITGYPLNTFITAATHGRLPAAAGTMRPEGPIGQPSRLAGRAQPGRYAGGELGRGAKIGQNPPGRVRGGAGRRRYD
jgi:hypothetical protein